MRTIWITAAALAATTAAQAECVEVKYREGGPVCLDAFKCEDVTRSSQVSRVCYDQAKRYMLIRLIQRSGDQNYYHYCEVSKAEVGELLSAESIGSYFASNIRSSKRGERGPHDCRDYSPPVY